MGWHTGSSLESLLRRDSRLTHALHGFVIGRFGTHWAEEALKVYLSPLEAGTAHLALFLAWALHHWKTEEGITVNEAYLAKRGDSLSAADRAWLRSQAAARLSLWEVREQVPGRGIRVRDLLGDETRFLHDEESAHWFPLHTTWLARVVEHEGRSLYRGFYAGYLSQPTVDLLVRATREALQGVTGRDEQALRVIQTWTGYFTPVGTHPPC